MYNILLYSFTSKHTVISDSFIPFASWQIPIEVVARARPLFVSRDWNQPWGVAHYACGWILFVTRHGDPGEHLKVGHFSFPTIWWVTLESPAVRGKEPNSCWRWELQAGLSSPCSQDDLVIADCCLLFAIDSARNRLSKKSALTSFPVLDLYSLFCSKWLHGFNLLNLARALLGPLRCLADEPHRPSWGHAILQRILHMTLLLRLQMRWDGCYPFDYQAWELSMPGYFEVSETTRLGKILHCPSYLNIFSAGAMIHEAFWAAWVKRQDPQTYRSYRY